jgi:hypothetical protein
MPKHVGVKSLNNLERINKEFLEQLLVFSQTVLQNARFSHQDRHTVFPLQHRFINYFVISKYFYIKLADLRKNCI